MMDNEEKAKKLIKAITNPKADFFYDIYDCITDENKVQSFFNYLVLQKIHCCARNIFNILIYFAENIERLNKKKEIDMCILYEYEESDKKKENLLDSCIRIEANFEFLLKKYCRINNIRFNMNKYLNVIHELSNLSKLKFVDEININENGYSISNNLFRYELLYDDSDRQKVLNSFPNYPNNAKPKKIIIKMNLNNFIEIFSSISYKTKQFFDFIKDRYSKEIELLS